MTAPAGPQSDQRDVTVNLRTNNQDYVTGMNQSAAATGRMSSAVDTLDAKLRSLEQRVSHGLGTFAKWDFGVLGVGAASAATFDKQLGTLNASAAVTGQNFAGVKGAVEGAFTSLPASRTSIIQLIETINNLGVTGSRQLGQLAQTFIKLGEATGEGPSQLAQGLIQLSRLMGNTDAHRIGDYANSLLTVSKNAGVSATGVLDFAQSIAPMARQAGIGEAAVLGISAAFSKAGADGFVAANTFNSMVSDITRLTQSGSPELAKYANLIGVTTTQFKSMDKTTALQDIFSTIAKQGPAAINTLNRLGYDGVRAQSALSAVFQSGDLNKQIAIAQGSSGDQKNLNKGASAATNNLADDLARLRNEMTQFGTEIGETFIGPLKIGVNFVDDLAHGLNNLIKPIAPIVAGFGAVAGAIAGISGAVAGLGHLILTGGLISLLVRGGPIRALREGLAAGRGVAGESVAEREARLRANPSANLYATGRMPLRARIPYVVGRGVGELRSPIDPNAEPGGPGVVRQAARFAVRGPGLIVGGLAGQQTRLVSDMGAHDYARSAYATSRAEARIAALPTIVSQGSRRESDLAARESQVASIRQEEAARAASSVSLREGFRNQVAANKASLETQGTLRAFGRTVFDVTKALIRLDVQTAKTGASLVTGGRIGGARTEGIVGAAGAAEAGATRGLGSKIFSGLGGGLGVGLLATAFLPGLIGGLGNGNQHLQDLTGSENAFTKYDTLLGTTSTNLAQFGSAVAGATDKLNGLTGKSLAQIAQIKPEDVTAATSGYKVVDSNISTLAKAAPKNTAAAVAYLQTGSAAGAFAPEKFDAIKKDLIAAYGKPQAQQILDAYLAATPSAGAQPKVDYAALGATANPGSGAFTPGGTKNYKDLVSQALSGARSQAQVAGGPSSQRAELSSALQVFGGSLSGQTFSDSDVDQVLQAQLRDLIGGKASDYNVVNTAGSNSVFQKYLEKGKASPQEIQRAVIKAITNTSAGKKYLQSAGIDLGQIKKQAGGGDQYYDAIISALGPGVFPGQQTTALSKQISGLGSFGRFTQQTGGLVQTAIAAPDDLGAQHRAVMGLYQQAGSGTKSADQLNAAFDTLTGTIKDTTDPLYQLARAARAYAQQQEQYALPYKSRVGQLGQTAKDYREAVVAQRLHPTSDTAGDLATAQQSYQQQLQQATQFEIQMQQQSKAYGVQMTRAAEDYHTSQYRSERDFGIQMAQMQQDRNTQLFRQQRDHNRQMAEQAQGAAQTIYPTYTRVMAVYTADSSTILQNLGDQNQRLKTQRRELDALKKMGLSVSAIQTLDLANISNAQQLDRLVMDAKNDPSIIPQLNAATATRVALTKSVTQNEYNLQFAQTNQDYLTGLKDASHDYDLARTRAVDAQQRALGDMATDYNKMVTRSAQDLTTAMTEIYGSFGDNYEKTLKLINDKIGKYSPELAKTLTLELKAMRQEIDSTTSSSIADILPGVKPPPTHPKPVVPHAMGVISTQAHTANISEGNRPEAIIPLDSRGQQFMSQFYMGVAEAVKNMQAKSYASTPGGSGGVQNQVFQYDQSTNYTGEIKVEPKDLKDFQDQLEQKARLQRLSHPQRH